MYKDVCNSQKASDSSINPFYRVRQKLFFGKFFEKNYYFLKFLFFYLKVQSFRLIMENNFIQMAASADHTVAYTIGPIFTYIIDCVHIFSSISACILQNYSR